MASEVEKINLWVASYLEYFVNMVIDHDSSIPDNDQDFRDKFAEAETRLTTYIDSVVKQRIDELVVEVLGMYAEDVFTPPTDDDRDKFNELNPNAHTRIHCGGIRHGLHQLRRKARGLSPREDLEVIHVPESDRYEQMKGAK